MFKAIRASLFISAFLTLSIANASLGGHLNSIKNDRVSLRAEADKTPAEEQVTSKEKYILHEITLEGQTVREYTLKDGTVFAVTWNGLSQPDLSVLFGTYYKEYKSASIHQKKMRRGSPQLIKSENLVVERSGHMRDVRGKAYLPKLVPDSLKVGELQ